MIPARARRLARIQFIFAMAVEFGYAGLSGREAMRYASDTFHDYLKEIGARFGDAGFDWSPEAGAEAARWMEIDYWETTA